MAQNDGSDPDGGTPIGQIPLRKVSRAELDAKKRAAAEAARANPMNRLVPYLDLFARLSDAELSRLASVPEETVGQLRKQVVAVSQALSRYVDLLPRLSDAELMRLTAASAKTIRFWRLCQPRTPTPGVPGVVRDSSSSPVAASEAGAPTSQASESDSYPVPSRSVTGSHQAVGSRRASDSGIRPVPTPVPRTPTPAPASADSQLGVSGAPFPGYDYDPNEPPPAEQEEDGIVIGLELSDV